MATVSKHPMPLPEGDESFRDGLGVRCLVTDASNGDQVERLYLAPDLARQALAVDERTSRLVNFRHARFARLRGVEADEEGQVVWVSAEPVEGVRLFDVLQAAEQGRVAIDVNTALQLAREVLPALATLHDSRRVTHGALGPERLVLTPQARLTIVDHGLGAALAKLQFPRTRLWREFRIAVPPAAGVPRLDERADVAMVAMTMLAALLGRPITLNEFPDHVRELLDKARERPPSGRERPLSASLRAWLERTLPIDSRRPLATALDAQVALEEAIKKERSYAPGASALKHFVERLGPIMTARATPPLRVVAGPAAEAEPAEPPARAAVSRAAAAPSKRAARRPTPEEEEADEIRCLELELARLAAEEAGQGAGAPAVEVGEEGPAPSASADIVAIVAPGEPANVAPAPAVAAEVPEAVADGPASPAQAADVEMAGDLEDALALARALDDLAEPAGEAVAGAPQAEVVAARGAAPAVEAPPEGADTFEVVEASGGLARVELAAIEGPAVTEIISEVPLRFDESRVVEFSEFGAAGADLDEVGVPGPIEFTDLVLDDDLDLVPDAAAIDLIGEFDAPAAAPVEIVAAAGTTADGLEAGAPLAVAIERDEPAWSSEGVMADVVPGAVAESAATGEALAGEPAWSLVPPPSEGAEPTGSDAADAAPVWRDQHTLWLDFELMHASRLIPVSSEVAAPAALPARRRRTRSRLTAVAAAARRTPLCRAVTTMVPAEAEPGRAAAPRDGRPARPRGPRRSAPRPAALPSRIASPPATLAPRRQAGRLAAAASAAAPLHLVTDRGPIGERRGACAPMAQLAAHTTAGANALALVEVARALAPAPPLHLLPPAPEIAAWLKPAAPAALAPSTSSAPRALVRMVGHDGLTSLATRGSMLRLVPAGAARRGPFGVPAIEPVLPAVIAARTSAPGGEDGAVAGTPEEACGETVCAQTIEVIAFEPLSPAAAMDVPLAGAADASPEPAGLDALLAESMAAAAAGSLPERLPLPGALADLAFDASADAVAEAALDVPGDVAFDVVVAHTPDVSVGAVLDAVTETAPQAPAVVALAAAADIALEAPADAALDAVVEVAPDVPADVAFDAVADVTLEAPADAALDVVSEIAPDVPADVALDASPDAALEVVAEVALEACADAAPSAIAGELVSEAIEEPGGSALDDLLAESVAAALAETLPEALAVLEAPFVGQDEGPADEPAADAVAGCPAAPVQLDGVLTADVAEPAVGEDEALLVELLAESVADAVGAEADVPSPHEPASSGAVPTVAAQSPMPTPEAPVAPAAAAPRFVPGEGLVLDIAGLDVRELRVASVAGTGPAPVKAGGGLLEAELALLAALIDGECAAPGALELEDIDAQPQDAEVPVLVEEAAAPEAAALVPATVESSSRPAVAELPGLDTDPDFAALMAALREVEDAEAEASAPAPGLVQALEVVPAPAVEPPAASAAIEAPRAAPSEPVAASPATVVVEPEPVAVSPALPAPQPAGESAAASDPAKRRRSRGRGRRRPSPAPTAVPMAPVAAVPEVSALPAAEPVPVSPLEERRAQTTSRESWSVVARRPDEADSRGPASDQATDGAQRRDEIALSASPTFEATLPNYAPWLAGDPLPAGAAEATSLAVAPAIPTESERTSVYSPEPLVPDSSAAQSASGLRVAAMPVAEPAAAIRVASPTTGRDQAGPPSSGRARGLSQAADLEPAAPLLVVPAERPSRRPVWLIAAAVALLALAAGALYWVLRPAPQGTLAVEASTLGLEVLIDGHARGIAPVSVELPAGRHEVEVRGHGASRKFTVDVVAGRQTKQQVNWSEGRSTGSLRVTSTPEGAKVLIGGELRGVTPVVIDGLAAGQHQVIVEGDSGLVRRQAKVTAGVVSDLDVSIFSGWLQVFAPFKMEVREDGRRLGTSEDGKLLLPPGTHQLELVNDTYAVVERHRVEVTPGGTTTLSVDAPTGTIEIAAPDGTQVLIDNEPLGTTPLGRPLRVKVGTHNVVLSHAASGRVTREVVRVMARGAVRVVLP